MKKTLLAVAVAGTLALSNVASADTILGITINPGDFLQIGTIWEGSLSTNGTGTIQATGEQLVGVGVVDVIKDADGNVTWASGTNGVYLAFYFDSYITQSHYRPCSSRPPDQRPVLGWCCALLSVERSVYSSHRGLRGFQGDYCGGEPIHGRYRRHVPALHRSGRLPRGGWHRCDA
ncbi:MAG: hypothetical protein IPO75_03745 [Betaproteobacteria bacterium]|nr:hypothetical protein [Betaproteobacteria bacterium]